MLRRSAHEPSTSKAAENSAVKSPRPCGPDEPGAGHNASPTSASPANIPNKAMTRDRPAEAADRAVPGHSCRSACTRPGPSRRVIKAEPAPAHSDPQDRVPRAQRTPKRRAGRTVHQCSRPPSCSLLVPGRRPARGLGRRAAAPAPTRGMQIVPGLSLPRSTRQYVVTRHLWTVASFPIPHGWRHTMPPGGSRSRLPWQSVRGSAGERNDRSVNPCSLGSRLGRAGLVRTPVPWVAVVRGAPADPPRGECAPRLASSGSACRRLCLWWRGCRLTPGRRDGRRHPRATRSGRESRRRWCSRPVAAAACGRASAPPLVPPSRRARCG